MDKQIYLNYSYLWIIKLQRKTVRIVHNSILASFLLFFVPIITIGIVFHLKFKFNLLTADVLTGLLWLGLAPWIITKAHSTVVDFFMDNQDIFVNKADWEKVMKQEIYNVQSPKYLLFGIPWTILTVIILYFTKFFEAPLPIQIWAAAAFGLLFLISSIGFQGIYALNNLLNNVFRHKLTFYSNHPDNFGGFSKFGKFAVKISLFFSSGALLFPLAFDVIDYIMISPDIMRTLLYFATGFYLLIIILGFIIPMLKIKTVVDGKKEALLLESQKKLDDMLVKIVQYDKLDIKTISDMMLYYYFHHRKIEQLKIYPFDKKVIVEFSFSFILPLLMFWIEYSGGPF